MGLLQCGFASPWSRCPRMGITALGLLCLQWVLLLEMRMGLQLCQPQTTKNWGKKSGLFYCFGVKSRFALFSFQHRQLWGLLSFREEPMAANRDQSAGEREHLQSVSPQFGHLNKAHCSGVCSQLHAGARAEVGVPAVFGKKCVCSRQSLGWAH